MNSLNATPAFVISHTTFMVYSYAIFSLDLKPTTFEGVREIV